MMWGILLIVLGVLFMAGAVIAWNSVFNLVSWRGWVRLTPSGNRVALFVVALAWLGIGISMVSGVL